MLRIALITFIFSSLLLNWIPVQWQSLGDFNIIVSICCAFIIVFYRKKLAVFVASACLTTVFFVYSPIQSQSQLLNSVDKEKRELVCTVHIVSPKKPSLYKSVEALARVKGCDANFVQENRSLIGSAAISGSKTLTNRVKTKALEFSGQNIRLFIPEKWSQNIEYNHSYKVVIKVKPVRQKKNFNQFDFEKYAFSNQLIWSAKLKKKPINILDSKRSTLLDLKEAFRANILNLPISEQNAGLFKALMMGDKSELSEDMEDIVSRSGLMHLLVISGLHLGLFAGYGVFLAFVMTWLFPRLCSYLPRKDMQALFAVGFASLYWIVLPTSEPIFRAWLTLMIWSVLHVSRFKMRLVDKLLMSCCGVILIDPMASLSMGFHLTMAALASICFLGHLSQKLGLSRLHLSNRFISKSFVSRPIFSIIVVAVCFQIGMSILMMPFLLANQMPISSLSPFINLVAVPIFSLFIMPSVVLLSALSSIGFEWSINALNSILSATNDLIQMTRHLVTEAWIIDVFYFYDVTFAIVVVAAFIFISSLVYRPESSTELWLKQHLSPRVMVCLVAMVALTSVSLLTYRLAIEPNQAKQITLEFHDVGQGTAVSWHDGHVVSFFDTGPSWNELSTLEQQVIPQFSKMRGEALIVSHNDNDHAGAIYALLNNFSFDAIYSGERLVSKKLAAQNLNFKKSEKSQSIGKRLFDKRVTDESQKESKPLHINSVRCIKGLRVVHSFWTAEVLYPVQTNKQGNAASCTVYLTINTNPVLRVLLSGDINQQDEQGIIQRLSALGGVEILMLSHHGSRYSNSETMLNAASATYAISTTGFWNHYSHPAKQTLSRIKDDMVLLDTAKDGAIRFVLDGGQWVLKKSREKRYIWQFIES
jgi:competence protein ComEC